MFVYDPSQVAHQREVETCASAPSLFLTLRLPSVDYVSVHPLCVIVYDRPQIVHACEGETRASATSLFLPLHMPSVERVRVCVRPFTGRPSTRGRHPRCGAVPALASPHALRGTRA